MRSRRLAAEIGDDLSDLGSDGDVQIVTHTELPLRGRAVIARWSRFTAEPRGREVEGAGESPG
jgi:hypothetical protein